MAQKAIRPIRIEGNIAYVPLTKGYTAIIDAQDAHLVNRRCWHAMVNYRRDGSLRCVYAARTDLQNGKKVLVLMHRLIMSAEDGMEVDHRDGDGLHNRRLNLRLATREQNARNQRHVAPTSARGTTYVSRRKKWQAQIKVAGKSIYLGAFETESDAHAAYSKASAELHGEFGRTA